MRTALLATVLTVWASCAPTSVLAQGRCQHAAGTPSCRTDPIKPVFASTGWKTTALDHITFRVVDARSEAAFYAALLGWTVTRDDGAQIVMDMGGHGYAVFRSSSLKSLQPPKAPAVPVRTAVDDVGFVIAPWNAERVAGALRERGLIATADNDASGFQSFRFKGPDGLDVQISNRPRYATPTSAPKPLPVPFTPTGWRTVWLDHVSLRTANYKATTSFYENLLGWTPTYDEGSQNQLLMGDVGDVIVRGGNPLDPTPAEHPIGIAGRIDHISLGIAPWDADAVRAALEIRHLSVTVDTANSGDIRTAPFKSYHTTTPNGYNLQISMITRSTRSVLPTFVRPRSQ